MVRGLARRVRRSKRRRQGRSSKGIANRVRDKNEGRDREKDRRGGGDIVQGYERRALERQTGERERIRHLPLPRGNLTFRLGLREPTDKEGGQGDRAEGRTRGTLARVVVCAKSAFVCRRKRMCARKGGGDSAR